MLDRGADLAAKNDVNLQWLLACGVPGLSATYAMVAFVKV